MLAKRSNRLNIFLFAIILLFIALVARFGYLQLINGTAYQALADGNRIRIMPIMAPRGLIYDRNGETLVSNEPGFAVAISPVAGPVPEAVLDRLAVILAMDPREIRLKIEQRQNRSLQFIRIKDNVSNEVITQIEERRREFPGVTIEVKAVRHYLYQELAAHLFGYVGEISDPELKQKRDLGYRAGDIVGKAGLEQVYDQELRGINGGKQLEVDVAGEFVQLLGKKEPIPGNNLVLTIDARIQKTTEKALDDRLQYLQTRLGNINAKAAAAVVMNPQTGEVLAMASRPAFNPNVFNGGISPRAWEEINTNPFNPMLNRVINAEYPPGSAFKIVTGAAALETGKITTTEKILDTGRHWLVPKGNAHGAALGWIDFHVALAKSDNVYFYELGNRLGIDELEKWAYRFGLGAPTGINLPHENEGLVANRAYKQQVFDEEWYLSETFDAAIGQGFQLATPLQLAAMISQIANGGQFYRPYLVSKILAPDGEIVKTFGPEKLGSVPLSPATLTAIRQALRDVVTPSGSAGYVFTDFPVPIAGKTSTVENPHGDDHGWFVAYGPYDNPTVAIAVIVEQGGYGSDAAAPIARKIFETVFELSAGADAAEEPA